MIGRAGKWLGLGLLVLVAVPLLALLIVLAGANTTPGRHFIEHETTRLTAGMIQIEGLAGRFPDALRARRIQISDTKGPYVTIEGLRLDWSPLALLHATARVDALRADQVTILRQPVPQTPSTTSSTSFTLPLRVDLRQLHLARLSIAPPVAGVAARFGVEGSAAVSALNQGQATLDITRQDQPGHYSLNGRITPAAIHAALTLDEPAHGLISELAQLPDLGALSLHAAVDGPQKAMATQLALTAGPLRADASGTIDAVHDTADLRVKATSPAMAPATGLSWQSILLDATLRGPLKAPSANGTVRIDDLRAGGTRIGSLDATIAGTDQQAQLRALLRGLMIPGPNPDLFAAAPITVTATTRWQEQDRPVTFSIQHPLLAIDGTARLGATPQVQAHVVLPDLHPLAAAGGQTLDGHAALDLHAQRANATTQATLSGTIGITGGTAPLPALVGPAAKLALAATLRGPDITVSRLTLDGKSLRLATKGELAGNALDAAWQMTLNDLSALRPDLGGNLTAEGTARGSLNDLSVRADIGADVSAHGYSSGHVTARIAATGLPTAPHATVQADGTLLGAPLTLALAADEAKGAVTVAVTRASWKSLTAGGTLTTSPGRLLPTGDLRLDVGRLADLRPLIGQPIAGQAHATLTAGAQTAKLTITLQQLAVAGTAAVGKADLLAHVTGITDRPVLDATVTTTGVSAGTLRGVSARATAKGPLDALAMTLSAQAPALAGGPVALDAGGTLDTTTRQLALARMQARWKNQTLRLLHPARIGFAQGISLRDVALGFRRAVLLVSGSVNKTLDLTASLRDLPASVAAIADPTLAADGTIAATARLQGTTARPTGRITLSARGVRLRQGPGQALPPANLEAAATLTGTAARIESRLTAGTSRMTAAGTLPLGRAGTMNVRSAGQLDLAMLDPLLTANGRQARGAVRFDITATGTPAAPQLRGTADLTHGIFADYTLGARLDDITAAINADGDTIRLARFHAKAGSGSVDGSGTIGLGAGLPVDLHLTANNARPLSSDLMTTDLDANLRLQGMLQGDMTASGTVHVRRAEIHIPDKLPTSVAVLPVRDASAPPQPPLKPAPPSHIALDLTLDAPQQVFVRGDGLFAELGGRVHFAGTARHPLPSGGLKLRQGTISLVGSTLRFTEGSIGFTGAGIADPAIDFVATTTSPTITATLTVAGSVRAPKISLSSVPSLPQDEILAQLLFGTTTAKLSPIQMAEIGAALAQMSGATPGLNPLGSVRSALGLDQLSVGSTAAGNPTVEGGRYVARGVYVGAKQATSGGGTQGVVRIDLAKGLKLEATAGSGTTSATGAAGGSDAASVGLTYQFQY